MSAMARRVDEEDAVVVLGDIVEQVRTSVVLGSFGRGWFFAGDRG